MSDTPRIIGLVGRAGAGKDTVGHLLNKLHGFETLSFATPLKQICRDVFDFSDAQLFGPSECRNAPDPRYPRPGREPLSPREALQQLGTEWGRTCFPDVWAALGIRRARARTAEGISVAFTDCRFVNEARAILGAGGDVWRIWRSSADAVRAVHASETEMDTPAMLALVTRGIVNNGTIEDLKHLVRQAL